MQMFICFFKVVVWLFVFGVLSLVIVGVLVVFNVVYVSVFQFKENSVKGLGCVYVGLVIVGGDVLVVVNNLVVMSELDGMYFQVDVIVINFSVKFYGSVYDVFGCLISGGNGGDVGIMLLVFVLFFVIKVLDKVYIGVGFLVLFGFQIEYDCDWVGCYNGIKFKFQLFDVMLLVFFDVSDNFVLGVSVIVQCILVEFISVINFNVVGLQVQQGIGVQIVVGVVQIQVVIVVGQILLVQGVVMIQVVVQQGQVVVVGVVVLILQGVDGYVCIKGDDWGYGYQVGGFWKFMLNDKFVLNYCFKISYKFSGIGNFIIIVGYDLLLVNLQLVVSILLFVNIIGIVDFIMFVVVSVSYWYQVEKFGLGIDLVWIKWDVFKELCVKYGNLGQLDIVEEFNWCNMIYVLIGGDYYFNDKVMLCVGIVVDILFIYNVVCDVCVFDFICKLVIVGIGYKVSEYFEINVLYVYIFVNQVYINSISFMGDVVIGNFDDYGNLLSFLVVYKF